MSELLAFVAFMTFSLAGLWIMDDDREGAAKAALFGLALAVASALVRRFLEGG